MANVYLQDSTLTAIGNAIRAKAGNTTQLLPSEMPAAITNLPSGGGDVDYDYYALNPTFSSTDKKIQIAWTTYCPDLKDLASCTICWGKSYIIAMMVDNSFTNVAGQAAKKCRANIRLNEGTLIYNTDGYIYFSNDGKSMWISTTSDAPSFSGSGQFTVQFCVRK